MQAPKNDSAFFEFLAWCDANASHALYSYYDGRAESLANSYLLGKHKDSIAEEFARRVHSVNRRSLVNLWLSPVVAVDPQSVERMVDILLRIDPTLRDTVDSWGRSRIDYVYDLSKKRVENPFEFWEFTDVVTDLLRKGVKPSASLKDQMKQYVNQDSTQDAFISSDQRHIAELKQAWTP